MDALPFDAKRAKLAEDPMEDEEGEEDPCTSW